MANMTLTATQEVSLSISPVDRRGNAAALDGSPVWTVSNPAILSVAPSSDGLSAVATAVGPIGTSQISVIGDADLGDGVVSISGTLDVSVIAAQATTFTIVTAAAVEQA